MELGIGGREYYSEINTHQPKTMAGKPTWKQKKAVESSLRFMRGNAP